MKARLLILSFSAIFTSFLITAPVQQAEAVVYCKTVGIPKGCVVRPAAPVVRRAVVTPGLGAPGVGVRPGTPMNRGGPVNRVGRH
jgi:hypothetical protein